ncbi:MAG: hypothetical protein ACOYWZ_14785 [Bacillota bacterium]
MSDKLDNVPLKSDPPVYEKKQETESEKSPEQKVDFSVVTTKKFVFNLAKEDKNMGLFDILKHLYEIRQDDTLSMDEKRAIIKKMIEQKH